MEIIQLLHPVQHQINKVRGMSCLFCCQTQAKAKTLLIHLDLHIKMTLYIPLDYYFQDTSMKRKYTDFRAIVLRLSWGWWVGEYLKPLFYSYLS